MTEPTVAVVVVAFGHAAQLQPTFQSILAQDYPASQVQIILVDNGDGASGAVARTLAPAALVIEPGHNLGFAGGCNIAVAQSTAEIIVLVNPDAELDPAFIHALVDGLDEPGVGIVGARLLRQDGRTLQHAGGEIVFPLALTRHRGYGQPDGPDYQVPTDVAYVTGAAVAIRRTDWQRLGGLDEAFAPAYYEEVDLCLRATAAGLRVRYVPAAVATHRETSTLGRESIAYYRLYHANRLRLLFKHKEDRWLATTWLPAELQHLRTTAVENEIEGLQWAYRIWQAHFLLGGAGWDVHLDDWQAPPLTFMGPPPGSELAWTLAEGQRKHILSPKPFTSKLPGVARARAWWNSLATEAYVRPLIQQQNDFNATVMELATALERQRRTADGAVLCQGMLLTKLLGADHRRR